MGGSLSKEGRAESRYQREVSRAQRRGKPIPTREEYAAKHGGGGLRAAPAVGMLSGIGSALGVPHAAVIGAAASSVVAATHNSNTSVFRSGASNASSTSEIPVAVATPIDSATTVIITPSAPEVPATKH